MRVSLQSPRPLLHITLEVLCTSGNLIECWIQNSAASSEKKKVAKLVVQDEDDDLFASVAKSGDNSTKR